ncbi:MAG: DUF1501 domain-containing protein, partial [Limisphaerales bacterium]
PSMNAMVEYLSRNSRSTAPASVWMPCNPGWGQKITRPGPFAGWLGRKWDPLVTDVELRDTYEPKTFYDVQRQAAGNILVPGTKLPADITLDRFARRRSLAEQLHVQADRVGNSEAYERYDAYQKRALDILADNSSTDSAWRAFDLDDEKPALRDRYGRYLFGECALTARRLVERGTRFVTVYWESYDKTGGDPTAWDTHADHFNICKYHRLPPLDQTYTALCEDLQARGLLDETLVIVMGEMGRSPKVNRSAGRDHWSMVHNILLTGAGVKRGYVHGASDAKAERVTDKPVSPADFIATVYAAMGVDPDSFVEDASGRLRPMTPGGSVAREVLA